MPSKINNTHPDYDEMVKEWTLMGDTYAGARAVKKAGVNYLPPTSGMVEDGMNSVRDVGYKTYEAYKRRAVFHDVVAGSVELLLGLLHREEPVIELPNKLESLLDKATLKGESLTQLLRKINEQQLVYGRAGLLLDLPDTQEAESRPYIVLYKAQDILNWDIGIQKELVEPKLNLVVLDESYWSRKNNFQWESVNKYRVLCLGDLLQNEVEGQAVGKYYKAGTFEDNEEFIEDDLVELSFRGKKLEEIPFVFVNSKDLDSETDKPPLLGLANDAISIYCSEADYRQNLFMQGQDTLVIIGGNKKTDFRVGSGASILVPAGGDAKYIGVNSSGLSEQRQAIENDKINAYAKTGKFINNNSKQKESEEALRVRIGAETATLNSIALSGAFALETILKKAAEWIGSNPDEVIVKPNLDFVEDTISGKELMEYVTASSMGAPLSKRSIHKIMQDKGITEFDFEEEVDIIEEEMMTMPQEGTEAGGNPQEEEQEEDELA